MHNVTPVTSAAEAGALISAGTIQDTSVYDQSGEKLGSVDDVMIGKHDGKIAYAIMSFGGFLGIGEKFHPLPWNMLHYDSDLGGYRVSLTAEQLKQAPNFDRNGLSQDSWGGETDAHYARSGSTQPMGARSVSAI